MTITHKMTLDLQRKGKMPRIDVVQGDAFTRQVDLVLENGGKPWLYPICDPVARYCKPDGTMGVYDTLPTGAPAFSYAGNMLTLVLAPQMLTCPGVVQVQVEMNAQNLRLATFTFLVVVEPGIALYGKSEDYVNWTKVFLPQTTGAKVGQFLQISKVDDAGRITEMTSAENPAENATNKAYEALRIANNVAQEMQAYSPSGTRSIAETAMRMASERLVAPQSASVGQYFRVAAVDANGVVTAVEAVDAPVGGGNVDQVTLTSPDGTKWNVAVSDDGVITANKAGDNGDADEVMVFTPFKFIQVSDTHYQYSQDATAVLVANINALDDVDFVTNSGDLTLDQTRDDTIKAVELAEYKANFKDALDIPLYACVGGHDLCNSADTVWREHTGMERLHELVHKDCVFLFADVLLSGYLDWLEEKVAAHTGKRIFIYEHHPIENDAFAVGLKPSETRVTWSDDQMRRILRLLRNNHNIIWFTGHTHWPFKTAVNDVYNDAGLMGTIVHTPYLNAYQGWMVEVGEETTLLRGVSFGESSMEYLGGDYDYTIVQDTADYGEAEIITDGGTVSVGGTADISVYLAAAPRSNQIVRIVADSGISTTTTELVFTPANYATAQKVTVSGDTAGTGRLTLYSESKTTVRKVDVVAGSPVVNYFNKNKPLTSLGAYYGTVSSGSYQMSNLIPAKTGDRVRSNDLGSQTSMRLKMFDADFNYIAEAQNNVQRIDYTITEENVAYVSVVYRGATAGQADTIMVTVNKDLPSEYIPYNGEPVGYVFTNYADPENPSLTNGYYNSYFVASDASGENVSNLIPCVAGDVVYSNNGEITDAYVYLYDATRTLIDRVNWSRYGVTVENENAAYFSIGYANSATDLMIMKNQKIPGYYVMDTDIM